MLTLDEACNIAAQVTCPYVPGLQIHICHSKRDVNDEFTFVVGFEVYASQNKSIIKFLSKRALFGNTASVTGYDFLLGIRNALKDLLFHELDEHLRFDDMFVINPHPVVYQYPVIDKEMFRFQ